MIKKIRVDRYLIEIDKPINKAFRTHSNALHKKNNFDELLFSNHYSHNYCQFNFGTEIKE